MRNIITFLTFFICLSGFAQTQTEMNKDAEEAYKRADKELNLVYHKILTENKSDTVFIRNLTISQRNWIKFRDSEIKVKFPEREPGYYGSNLPMCILQYQAELTTERINVLKTYLHKSKEENICN
jgi:uncharacterized protein YecT (DUF1311 family)